MSEFKDIIRNMSRSHEDVENDVINELAEEILKYIKNTIKEDALLGSYRLDDGKRIIDGSCLIRYSLDNLENGVYPFCVSGIENIENRYWHVKDCEFKGFYKSIFYKRVQFYQIDVKLLEYEETKPSKSQYVEYETFIAELCISEYESKLRKRLQELAVIDEIVIKSYFLVSKCKKDRMRLITKKPNYQYMRFITSEIFEEDKITVTQEKDYYTYFDIIYQYEFEY